MTEDISALARDEVRIRQIDSLRRMGRLDPRSADAQALLFTSVRDGFSRSASLLLGMGVPPKYVGWTQQQADRYLAGDFQVASEMAALDLVLSTNRSVRSERSRHTGRSAHCA